MALSYLLSTILGSYATTGTTKQQLSPGISLSSNVLKTNGSIVRVIAYGTTAANNNQKSFSIEFAGREVAYMLTGANNRAMELEAILCRASSTHVSAFGQGVCGSQAMTLHTCVMYSLSSAISIGAFSTTAVAASGFVLRAMTIEELQAG